MMKKLALFVIVLLAAATIVVPASAGLVPMSWGFPVLIQNASLTGLQSQTATAHDIESAAIDFGGGGFGGSTFGGAFPSIAQFADQPGVRQPEPEHDLRVPVHKHRRLSDTGHGLLLSPSPLYLLRGRRIKV